MTNEYLNQINKVLSENTLWSWLAMAAIALIATIVIKFILKIVSSNLRKLTSRTHSVWDDVGVDLIDGFRGWVIFFWGFFILTKSLEPSEAQSKVMLIIVVLASSFQLAIWGLYLIKNWRQTVLDRRTKNDPSSAAALGLLYTIIQALFLTILFLIGLSNLGVNISALVAGLGVGGIAVALAAQNVLGDLLASLSIVLDKPFVVGDFISAGKEMGTVENIGIKTTRLRSLSGEEIVLSNKDLLESRIQNFKHMWQRRVVQKFGVTYDTSPELLEQIPVWVKGFVGKHDKLKFDRCHFASYGPSSLDFELVFIVMDPDYNLYMDIQQTVLLDILKKFNEEKIDFAFPTQTVFVEKLPEPKVVEKRESARPANGELTGEFNSEQRKAFAN